MTAVLPHTAAHRAPARPAPPSVARIALTRVGLELRLFARQRQQVVFSFAYPIVMMVIFGSVLGGDERPGDIPFPQYFLAGIAATGIMLTSFQALASAIAEERESGQLERLQLLGTPPAAYFAGKAGQVLVTTAAQLVLLLPVARYGFDVPMPADLAHWLTFAWVAALGALAGTVLGIAASALPGSATSVSTGVSAFAIVLQFFSGVFFAPDETPEWMQQIAAFLPLKWLNQGMRSAFLPDQVSVFEPGGGWEHGRTALVLAAWAIIGTMICIRAFRWRRSEG
jgi:ABC-2 type transport system permease protein